MSAKRVIKGFALGAAIGAMAGILFAPKTGKQSQKFLKAKLHMIKGMVAAKAAAARRLTMETYEKMVDEALVLAKRQKMTARQIQDLRNDLMGRWKEIKRAAK